MGAAHQAEGARAAGDRAGADRRCDPVRQHHSGVRVKPVLRHIANLWTLMGHPSRGSEWSLDEKVSAMKDAGFDGVCWAPSPELHEGAQRHGLTFVGGMA